MIQVIIIDDEPLAISMVKEYLATYDNIEVVADCPNGFAGAKAINELEPDLIFLDVQIPKITGFEMLEILDHMPAVIFTTAFDEFAIKAFEANAIDYLLKPFEKDRFDVAIQKFLKSFSLDTNPKIELSKELKMNRLVLKDAGEISILALKDVHYLQADNDYVQIHTASKRFVKKATLKYYESRLPDDQFARVHRSYLLNVGEVTRIEPYEKASHIAILKSGAKIPVSKAGYGILKMHWDFNS